jgi:phage FluMu gp28-like protein
MMARTTQTSSTTGRTRFRLLPYQRRWVEDRSRLKVAVKARQIGYSFAATLRAVLACVERKTTWIFLSKGERQSRLLMEKVHGHIRACGAVAKAMESRFFEGTSLRQLEARFPNGSVIYGLPANPDTARGYSGNVTLDEFAFHSDADRIYTALFPSVTRGFCLEVISTPNGQQGKFYEIAKAAGLAESGDRSSKFEAEGAGNRTSTFALGTSNTWSGHRCDIYEAARQGMKIEIPLLRAGCSDETAWQQEYCCAFISTAENFFSPELLAACLSAEASADTPPQQLASARGAREMNGGSPAPEFFLGIDVGRRHDRTVFWVDEVQGTGNREQVKERARGEVFPVLASLSPVPCSSITQLVRIMDRAPFAQQLAFARELMNLKGADGRPLVRRAAIDATGIGAMLAETLEADFGPRVEAIQFTSSVKEDLAYRTRRRMESGSTLLPDTPEVRRAFMAVKKFVTASGHLRFDAARTDAGHADEFWAKALADLAADERPAASGSQGFVAEARPVVDAHVFLETAAGWAGMI